MKSQNQNNTLFLICPASQLEPFIRERYGNRVYFLTALGTMFDFSQVTYAEALVAFLKRASINEIVVVCDTSCLFINAVLKKEKGYETYAEARLLEVLLDNYALVMSDNTLEESAEHLARLTIQRQIDEMLENNLLAGVIQAFNITLKGLLTTKKAGLQSEVMIKQRDLHQ